MKQNSEKTVKATKNKKSAGEIISKILTAVCALAAVVLIGVTAFAVINEKKEKGPDTGNIAPEIITTVPSTTLAPADSVKVKRTVYTKSDADAYAEASADATVFASLKTGESVGLVKIGDEGWCTVTYNEKVCYIQRKHLTTKKPENAAETERKVVDVNQKRWSIVVVDKNRELPEGYEPELVNIVGTEYSLETRVADYFEQMYDAARQEGIELTPYSAYRSYATQEDNYNALVKQFVEQGYSQQDAEVKAATEILPAGCSEHNLGYAVDIVSADDSFKDTDEYKWLCENAYKYGFIERYPEGSQDVTGVIAEPWHWRFVGPFYANKMREEGAKTLEEFLQSYDVEY